ncbi:MAG: hypothetical protein E7365_07670 [Clostridiales bacterium]|nr:hypothetical protein [Clostridiales bacterium]
MKQLIDFDAQFNQYMDDWAETLLKKGKKPEEIEEMIPQAYQAWANKAKEYFSGMSVEELVKMLGAYLDEDINVPDILLDKIVETPECEKGVFDLFMEERSDSERVTLMNVLSDMGSKLFIQENINILCYSESEVLAEAAAEALKYAGEDAQKELLRVYGEEYDNETLEKIVYVLVYSEPKVEGLGEKLISLMNTTDNKAIIAGMMAFYGDDKCLPVLKTVENSKDINYIDYVEICDAIEALGGETSREREFDGDEYYEMMHNGGFEG